MKQKINEIFRVKLRPYQDKFIFSKDKFPALISGWGTGKTLALIMKAVLKSQKYPKNLGIIARKEFEDLRDSTCKDFEEYTGMKISSKREVCFPNGSIIMFRHLEELNNIQNINLGWFAIEQAEELENDDIFLKMIGRLRRKNCGIQQGFIIGNTCGHNWIYELWKLGSLKAIQERIKMELPEGTNLAALYEAATFDNNENLDPQFLSTLRLLKERRPKLYNRFVLNSWDDEDVDDIVIPSQYVEDAKTHSLVPDYIKRIVTCDPSRGGDEFVVYYMENTDIKDRLVLTNPRDSYEAAAKVHLFALKHKAHILAGDSGGLGAPIMDTIRAMSEGAYIIHEVNSSNSSANKKKFLNRRAEIWWMGGESFVNHEVKLTYDDPELRRQLISVKYKIIGGIIRMEEKKEVKKRLGNSPDRADAYIIGLDAYRNVDEKQLIKKENMSVVERWKKRWYTKPITSAWAA